jgi:uncharacterized protein YggU (UPF0235/DUF167 family)
VLGLVVVEVRPRARQDALGRGPEGRLRASVTAAPVDGAANEAVRALLAQALGCPRAAVEIVRGARGRTKLVRVAGLSAAELDVRLRTAVGA